MNYKDLSLISYQKFYKNEWVHNFFIDTHLNGDDEDNNISNNENNDPMVIINSLMASLANNSPESVEFLKQLIKSVTPTTDSLVSTFVEMNFYSYIINVAVNFPEEIVRFYATKLILNIINNWPITIDFFLNNDLFMALIHVITQSSNLRITTYIINIFIQLFDKMVTSANYKNIFTQNISITNLKSIIIRFDLDWNKVEQSFGVKGTRKNQVQTSKTELEDDNIKLVVAHFEKFFELLKNILILSKKISEFPLGSDDYLSAIFLVRYTFNHFHLNKNFGLFYLAELIMANMIENGTMPVEDFTESDLITYVKAELENGYHQSKISACHLFVSLIERNTAVVVVDDMETIFDYIDQADNHQIRIAYLRLLATMIKNDEVDGGYVCSVVVYQRKNIYNTKTICHWIENGNFEEMVSAIHCLVDLFQKVSFNLMQFMIYDFIIHALVHIGKKEDEEFILFSLICLCNIFDYSEKAGKMEEVSSALINSDGLEMVLENSNSENEKIAELSNKIFEFLDKNE